MSDENYDVGYGKPPREHQFGKGRSGNPKGRPKGSRSASSLIAEALAEPIALTENGRKRKVPVATAVTKRLIQKAIGQGDGRSIDRVIGLLEDVDAGKPPAERPLAANEQTIIENFLKRHLREAANG